MIINREKYARIIANSRSGLIIKIKMIIKLKPSEKAG
jgi:hypothetical protein